MVVRHALGMSSLAEAEDCMTPRLLSAAAGQQGMAEQYTADSYMFITDH